MGPGRSLTGDHFAEKAHRQEHHECGRSGHRLVPADEQPQQRQRVGILGAGREPALIRLHVGHDLRHVGIALRWLECHRPHRHRRERCRHLAIRTMRQAHGLARVPHFAPTHLHAASPRRAVVRRRRDVPALHVVQHLRHFAPLHGRSQGQDRVEDAAQRVDVRVGPNVRQAALRLFRWHVLRRAHHRAIHGQSAFSGGQLRVAQFLKALDGLGALGFGLRVQFVVEVLGQAPVHHQHFTKFPHHHVLRLQVPVDDALVVREGHRVADFPVNGQQPIQRVVLDGGRVALLDSGEDGLQRPPLHQLHGVVELTLRVAAHLVDGDDVGVFQPRQHQGFPQEALACAARGFRLRQYHLHRHLAVEGLVRGREDRTHATTRNLTTGSVGGAGVHALRRRLTETHFASSRFTFTSYTTQSAVAVPRARVPGGLFQEGCWLSEDTGPAHS